MAERPGPACVSSYNFTARPKIIDCTVGLSKIAKIILTREIFEDA
jgi:hypothetical protein